jgi:hypothetical protein
VLFLGAQGGVFGEAGFDEFFDQGGGNGFVRGEGDGAFAGPDLVSSAAKASMTLGDWT